MARLVIIACVIGAALAVAAGFMVEDLTSGSGTNQPAHATLYNYGSR